MIDETFVHEAVRTQRLKRELRARGYSLHIVVDDTCIVTVSKGNTVAFAPVFSTSEMACLDIIEAGLLFGNAVDD